MKQLTWTRMAAAVVAAAATVASGLGFVLVAPTSLGGTAHWVVTTGNSMEPGIHAGDLVIARPESGYRIGDVVAYPSDTLGGTVVLHRIIGHSPGGLVTRGDNNDWIDPDRPRSSQILGEMWLHIPGGGRMVSVFANPYLILALMVGMVALTVGGVAARRSRRRRGAPTKGARRRTAVSGPRGRGGGVVLPPVTQWAAMAALVFAGVAVFAFAQPLTTRGEADVDFLNSADLGYTARVQTPGVYASNRVQTGDPVFLSLAPKIETSMHYRLQATASEVSGTVQAVARISAGNGWEHTTTLTEPQGFTGPQVKQTTTVDFIELRRAAQAAEQAAGTTFGAYTVNISYDIEVNGSINGLPVETSYQPKLSFSLDPAQAVPLAETTQDIDAADGLVHTSEPGQLTKATVTENTIGLGGRAVPVRWLRTGGIALAVLTGAVAALSLTRGRRARHTGLESLHARLVAASNIELASRPVVDLDDAASLARLAEHHDTAVIYVPGPQGDLYHVIVDDTLYRYARPAPPDRVHRTSSHAALGSSD